MIIEVDVLLDILGAVPECPVCRLGRAVVVEENAGPHAWDVSALHRPTCRGANPIQPPPNLHLVDNNTGGDAA